MCAASSTSVTAQPETAHRPSYAVKRRGAKDRLTPPNATSRSCRWRASGSDVGSKAPLSASCTASRARSSSGEVAAGHPPAASSTAAHCSGVTLKIEPPRARLTAKAGSAGGSSSSTQRGNRSDRKYLIFTLGRAMSRSGVRQYAVCAGGITSGAVKTSAKATSPRVDDDPFAFQIRARSPGRTS